MDIACLRALYDMAERRDAEEPGKRRENTPGVVRHVDLVGAASTIIYSHLDPEQVDTAIRQQMAYFDRIGHTVEWKVYAHDQPATLHDRLLAHGFAAEETEAIMVLDLATAPPALLQAVPSSVRRVSDPHALDDVNIVHAAVWPADHSRLVQRLAFQLRTAPDYVSIYVADVDGVPVSAARINFPVGSPFASLWGGATVPAYRKRGFYTVLVAARVQEARQRGARFLTIDAGPMSCPIVEKLGFQLLSYARAHTRRPTTATAI